jgi:hypothetical protein
VIASVPRAVEGNDVASVTATARSDQPLLGAEMFVDHLGQPGSGAMVDAADGAFDEPDESVQTRIEVPWLTYPAGVHRLFVRARDASGWGAASVGVLIVDKQAPHIPDFGVLQVAPVSAGLPVEVTFRAVDDWADALTYTVSLTSQLNGEVVFVSEPQQAAPWRDVSFSFSPSTSSRGPHTVSLTVRDEALNEARRIGTTVLL